MRKQDWEKFGEDLGKIVQEAVDSQDFKRMNQMLASTISNTINDVAGDVATSIRNTRNARANSDAYNNGTRTNQPQRNQAQFQRTQNYQPPMKLYQNTAVISILALVFGIPAIMMSAMFGLVGLGFIGMAVTGEVIGIYEIIGFTIIFILMMGCLVGFKYCLNIRGLAKRFQIYRRIVGNREFCNVSELARNAGRTQKAVVKDLEKMIKKGWFVQGHLDEQKACLIVTHNMYNQYMKLHMEQKRVAQQKASEEMQKQEKRNNSRLSPEVQKVIAAGDAYVLKIRACNDAIPGEEVSAKMYRMEKVVDRIFDRVEENPESVDDIGKLMDYYLPTAIKLLEAYEELDKQPIGGENIRSSKAEIESALDTLNIAFEKILDDMFRDTAWDVSSDISVLNTMLAQEGLANDGFKK